MNELSLKIICFISLVITSFSSLGQEYQMMKSAVSNAGFNSVKGQLFYSHTIGQHSLVNTFQNEGIQLLQGFEHHLISKTIEQPLKGNIYAYPNPSIGPITIYRKNTDHENIRLAIYDLKGALAKSFLRITNSQLIKIDLSYLPKGYYQIRVESDNRNYGNCQILLK